MSIVEKLYLGLNTTVIGMGIVFLVLIALSIIITIQSKIMSAFSKMSFAKPEPEISTAQNSSFKKSGITSGETILIGIDDEETVALIMAIVSHHVNIPLNELKFKSIKAL